jgi:hypothetical protein
MSLRSAEPVVVGAPPSRPLVVIQQAAEPDTPTDSALDSSRPATLDQPIPQPLMIPLAMIVLDEFRHDSSEMALAERQHPIEAFLFNGPHEPLRVRIRIRGLPRCLYHADAAISQEPTDPRSISCPGHRPAGDAHAISNHSPLSACDRLAA